MTYWGAFRRRDASHNKYAHRDHHKCNENREPNSGPQRLQKTKRARICWLWLFEQDGNAHVHKGLHSGIITVFWVSFYSPKLSLTNPNFGQKSKFLSKIQILVKNPNFGQKSKLWSKIQIMIKNPNFGKKSKFGQKSKFWLKIQISIKNPNFGQKSKFSCKNKMLVKNLNYSL